MIDRPSASTSAAPSAQRSGPTRSGRSPATSRVITTIAAKAVKAAAPWPMPRSSSIRTMNDASAAKPHVFSASAAPGPSASGAISARRSGGWSGRKPSGIREATNAAASGTTVATAQTASKSTAR